MLPQETNCKGSVCDGVRVGIDALRDGRMTGAERAFVHAHIQRCAGCASAWAFAQSAKTAWGKMPDVYPSASLSARIAAATYRKPTPAQRFFAAFSVLSPAPVRAALGVAAIAGIAFLTIPRPGTVTVTQNSVSRPEPTVVAVAPPPAKAVVKAVAVKSDIALEKPVRKVVPNNPVIVAALPVVKRAPAVVATVIPVKVASKQATLKAKPVQVAALPRPPLRAKPVPASVADDTPKIVLQKPDALIAVTEPQPAPVVIAKPAIKEPEPAPLTAVAGMTVGEREPTDGYKTLSLRNAGRQSIGILRGSGAALVRNDSALAAIVSAPVVNR